MARRVGSVLQLDSGLLIPASAASGKVLVSDASGNATWASPHSSDILQAGCLGGTNNAGVISGSMNGSTRAVTFTNWPTNDPIYFLVSSVLQRGTMAAAPATTPGTLNTSSAGALAVDAVPGGDGQPCTYLLVQSPLNGSGGYASYLLASNALPAPAAGNVRIWDAIYVNSGGTYIIANGNSVLASTGAPAPWPWTNANGTAQRDRRPWARGADAVTVYTGGSQSTTIVGMTTLNGSVVRVECSGGPLEVEMEALIAMPAGQYMQIELLMDGQVVYSDSAVIGGDSTSWPGVQNIRQTIQPSAGSHVVYYGFAVSGGATGTVYGISGIPLIMRVRETVAQNQANGTA